MKENWKLKLVETIPYLVLAVTLLISVVYEKTTDKEAGRAKHDLSKRITLKSVLNSETDHLSKR